MIRKFYLLFILIMLIFSVSCSLTNNSSGDDTSSEPKKPEIVVKQGYTDISVGGLYDFDNVGLNISRSVVFTIENAGDGDLELTNSVYVSGAQCSVFDNITSPGSSTIIPGGSTTFAVTFTPTSETSYTSTQVVITNNDANNGNYTFFVAGTGVDTQEINLKLDDIELESGSAVYDFGDINFGSSSNDMEFTIDNFGTKDLIISDVTIDSPDFILDNSSFPCTIASSLSQTFTISFIPSKSVSKSAVVTIINNDPDEGNYVFNVAGAAVDAPEINVKQGSTDLIDSLGSYDFGTIDSGSSSSDIVFTIENLGTENLIISDVIIDSSEFTLDTSSLSGTIASSFSDTFTISFNPSSAGSKSATVTIANNDGDENPYTFVVTGTGETDIILDKVNNLGGTNTDCFVSVIESGDYYIAVGSSESNLSGLYGNDNGSNGNDFVIAKLNKSDLSLVDINNIGGTNTDYFESVIESGDYYIAVGSSDSYLSGLGGNNNVGNGYDYVIAKFNKSDLSLVDIDNSGDFNTDYFKSVIESGDYYIAVGSSDFGSTGNDFLIAKFNKSDLSLVDTNDIGGTNTDYFVSVIESGDYYIAVGSSDSNLSGLGGNDNGSNGNEFVIAKFNKSHLGLITINNLGGTNADCFESVIESGDYYIAVGYSSSDLSTNYSVEGGNTNSGNEDFTIAKFNKSDLSLAVVNNLGGSNTDCFKSVIESGDYYIAVGYTMSDLSGLSGGSNTQGLADFIIAKINKSDLSLVTINNLGGTNADYFKSVIESGDYYIAVGYTMSDLSGLSGGSNTQGLADFVIARFGN